jgi:hypothetical protein
MSGGTRLRYLKNTSADDLIKQIESLRHKVEIKNVVKEKGEWWAWFTMRDFEDISPTLVKDNENVKRDNTRKKKSNKQKRS